MDRADRRWRSYLYRVELLEGQIHTFSLDDYVTGDVAVSDISWSTDRSEHVSVDIDPVDRIVSLRTKSGWYGETTLEFVHRRATTGNTRPACRHPPPLPARISPLTLLQLPDINTEAGFDPEY